jgi:uncharacterized protein YraI
LVVETGYDGGALHFRPGPSKSFLPDWSTIGAVYEGDPLTFVDCPPTTYPWVHVDFYGILGYVYGKYLNVNPCAN